MKVLECKAKYERFLLRVPKNGYMWEDSAEEETDGGHSEGNSVPGPWLVEQNTQEGKAEVDLIHIGEFPALFLTFANTNVTKDAILHFANRFGFLEGANTRAIRIPDREYNNEYIYTEGESFETWSKELSSMARAVFLWETCRSGDTDNLMSYLRSHWHVLHSEANPLLASLDEEPHVLLQTIGGQRPEFITQFVLEQIARIQKEHLKGNLTITPILEVGQEEGSVELTPTSTLGALWLQFTQAVLDNRRYRKCRNCDMWFELHPSKARKSRFYCSDACRIKAHRGRKAEALRLYNDGVKIEQIEKTLGSSAKTVKGWIKVDDAAVSQSVDRS